MADVEKQRLNVTISKDILGWIDEEIESRRFASRTHALEFAVTVLKNSDKYLAQKVLELEARVEALEVVATPKKKITVVQHGTKLSEQEKKCASWGPTDGSVGRWGF